MIKTAQINLIVAMANRPNKNNIATWCVGRWQLRHDSRQCYSCIRV